MYRVYILLILAIFCNAIEVTPSANNSTDDITMCYEASLPNYPSWGTTCAVLHTDGFVCDYDSHYSVSD